MPVLGLRNFRHSSGGSVENFLSESEKSASSSSKLFKRDHSLRNIFKKSYKTIVDIRDVSFDDVPKDVLVEHDEKTPFQRLGLRASQGNFSEKDDTEPSKNTRDNHLTWHGLPLNIHETLTTTTNNNSNEQLRSSELEDKNVEASDRFSRSQWYLPADALSTDDKSKNRTECASGSVSSREGGAFKRGASGSAGRSKMGFSLSLQGPESHGALLGRQDAEGRLLDTMRRVLVARAKCDRDYSQALGHLAHTASKMDIPDNVLEDSLILKAWRVMVDSLEEWSSLMRQNSDTLVLQAVEKLAALITEKRASRKVYFENHQRITNEIPRYQEVVSKAKNNYEQALEHYKNSKAKYEEHYLKGKPGRKLDELKERYQKSCRKLHLMHNDYVLLLYEAADYERDFRTVLLPGLLEYQQTIQEDMVNKWKTLLQEVSQLTDPTRGHYAQLQQNINSAIDSISPSSEYNTFVENHRSSPPETVSFEFARDLLGPEGVGSLQISQLAVDSLTVDNLRNRLTELEQRLSDVSSDHRDKQNLLNQHETELASIKQSNTSDRASPIQMEMETKMRLSVLKRASDVLRKEISELKCKESWLQHQQSLIHEPLTTLGCEEAPQPWEAPSGGQHINGDTQQSTPHIRSDSVSLRSRSSALKDILKKPFHRGRNTSSTTTVINNGGVGTSPTSTPPTPTRASTEEPSLTGVDGAVVDNASVQDTPVGTKPNGVPKLTFDPDRQLEDEPWFHGVLPREEVVRLLVNEGDYLVRESTRNDERQVVLSVCWGAHKHFIVQTTPGGHYRFEGPVFPTIQELILYQHSCGLSVTNKSGAVLRTPIFREHWELNNDDVQLNEKIGRGNFGDVYKARLGGTGLEVAVKTCRVTLPEEQKKKFLQEGRILKQYDHPNIVRFIGICVQKQPIMIVMELVPGGSLLSYVRANKSKLLEKQKTSMCRDTAAGMAYLESKNCIHRDLAARNCLVGDRGTVKISDFGMSREEEEYIVSDGMKQIPIKWTAPEALNFGKYTSLCDVWSFGVLCWEIFSGGEVPYQGYSNTKAREMIDSGYRMLAPTNTPKSMHDLMLKCWQYDPEIRPHFDQILLEVETIYASL